MLFPDVRLNAMSDPSGEKRGSFSMSGVAVMRLAAPPAREVTQRSPPYSNAMDSRLIVGCRRRRVPWAPVVPAATTPTMIENGTAIERRGMTRLQVGKAFAVYYRGIPMRRQTVVIRALMSSRAKRGIWIMAEVNHLERSGCFAQRPKSLATRDCVKTHSSG